MPSREVQGIIDYAEASGIPYRVTATLGRYVSPTNPCDPHTATSLHCAEGTGGKGRAVDFGGAIPGTGTAAVKQMAALWQAFKPVAPQLAELFFNGPGITMVIKNGMWRPGAATLGPAWLAHRNHVHVAVPKGVFLTPPAPAPPAPVYDYQEATTKTMMMHIGPLDSNGNGWSDWDPGFGRDPIIVAAVLLGPSPPDDGYWEQQSDITLGAQPRGGKARVTVRHGKPADMVTAFVTVA